MFLNLVFKLHILDINTIHTRWIRPGSLGRALLDVPKSSLTFKCVIIIKKYLLLLKSTAGGDPTEGENPGKDSCYFTQPRDDVRAFFLQSLSVLYCLL